jgi:hypothetical protein
MLDPLRGILSFRNPLWGGAALDQGARYSAQGRVDGKTEADRPSADDDDAIALCLSGDTLGRHIIKTKALLDEVRSVPPKSLA